MKRKRATIQVYRDRKGEWRWRLRASNGLIVADGGEGYVRKYGVLRAISRVRAMMANNPAMAVEGS